MPGYDKSYPNACIEVGLTCEACTSHTAGEVARLCKGLRGKMVGQMFVQLYPRSGVFPDARAFRTGLPRGIA